MKLLVSAFDAQSGVVAGRKGWWGSPQWHVETDPAPVEA